MTEVAGSARLPAVVLASGSAHRRELLARLRLPFSQIPPEVDETPLPGESAAALVRRLSLAKARAVASRLDRPERALVIASDQAALLGETILGKPGTPERAREQLRSASGRRMELLTGLCLLDTASGDCQLDCIPYAVQFRRLDEGRIAAYVAAERPLDCAGSFRSEGLGIALFERMAGDDPTALVGLPLIRLVSMLERVGVILPLSAQDGGA